MIDLSNYTINQLTNLQSKVNKLISDYQMDISISVKLDHMVVTGMRIGSKIPKLFKTYVTSMEAMMASLMYSLQIKT